eukprot:Em0009g622a
MQARKLTPRVQACISISEECAFRLAMEDQEFQSSGDIRCGFRLPMDCSICSDRICLSLVAMTALSKKPEPFPECKDWGPKVGVNTFLYRIRSDSETQVQCDLVPTYSPHVLKEF